MKSVAIVDTRTESRRNIVFSDVLSLSMIYGNKGFDLSYRKALKLADDY